MNLAAIVRTSIAIVSVLIAVSAVAIVLGNYRLESAYNQAVLRLLATPEIALPGATKGNAIAEADLQNLPEPVRKYLRQAGVVGKPHIQTVKLAQKGAMRLKPEQPWIPFTAEQHFTAQRPGFVWTCRSGIGPLPLFRALDTYVNAKGNMKVKILSLFALPETPGPRLDEGTLSRYLAEMMWFPTSYLNSNVTWESIDDSSAKITLRHAGTAVSGVATFRPDNTLDTFTMDRYMDQGGTFIRAKWSARSIGEPKLIQGFRIPTQFEVTWHLDSGDFTWLKGDITDMEFDVSPR